MPGTIQFKICEKKNFLMNMTISAKRLYHLTCLTAGRRSTCPPLADPPVPPVGTTASGDDKRIDLKAPALAYFPPRYTFRSDV